MFRNKKERTLFREGYIEDFYIIEEEDLLGEGGSAVVRKATKKDSGEQVAVKILDK